MPSKKNKIKGANAGNPKCASKSGFIPENKMSGFDLTKKSIIEKLKTANIRGA